MKPDGFGLKLCQGRKVMSKSTLSRLRKVRKAARYLKTSTYEISAKCNLKCEGCLFFSGEHAYQHEEEVDTERWREFFRQEAERGITFAFLAGAEPALAPDRLRAAWESIPSGMIVTNGTRRIPEDIGYRLHISLWGSEESSELTRGGNVVPKAFRNYANDPRAVFVYTINALNIDEIRPMARLCAEHGVPMTFNYYSPTEVYQKELNIAGAERSTYFRFSTGTDNLLLTPEHYKRARETIESVMSELPATVIYSLSYDDWVTGEQVYSLDDEGIAYDCASRSDHVHGTFFVDQQRSDLKCSNPTFDCRECRTYASGMTSHVRIEHQNVLKSSLQLAWSDAFDCWDSLFVGSQWGRLDDHIAQYGRRL
jgi:MoaA/NifB/PqqE/SkfB family radical SAM enzyme